VTHSPTTCACSAAPTIVSPLNENMAGNTCSGPSPGSAGNEHSQRSDRPRANTHGNDALARQNVNGGLVSSTVPSVRLTLQGVADGH
jgi:hypothetical protein